ncbi:hypothetical protein ACFQPA_03610 [Halomarina halobia]|uniref:Uncharacterized protein n=1 Tax=Halomarina halobia TaxID=3033386 RepID=A0ABD6A6E1_9EURY|nr:hypothetical protein [Halomarina sp. PSR21]
MIVVATEDFEVYHGVVNELRERGAGFTTQELDDPLPPDARLLIVGPDDDVREAALAGAERDVAVVRADPAAPRAAVEEALAVMRGAEGRTVVGIDPGERPGIAVLSGDLVVAAFQVPATDAAEVVRRELEEAVDPVVRIGDGARLVGARIVDDLAADVPVELVDETGTTPYVGTGARGMGDVLAAVNIALLPGERVEGREIEPTDGEIQVIKSRSRERSEDNRTITESLARRVARGELSLDEALDEHRRE